MVYFYEKIANKIKAILINYHIIEELLKPFLQMSNNTLRLSDDFL